MRAKRTQRLIERYVLPSLPGFAVQGRLLYRAPVAYIVRGYSFEDSGFEADLFTVWAFVQPLFVPADCEVFSLGNRLGALAGGTECWWKGSAEREGDVMTDVLARIRNEGEPRFQGVVDPKTLLVELERIPNSTSDLYMLETAAARDPRVLV